MSGAMESCISAIDFDNSCFEAIWGLPQPHIDLLIEQRLVYGTEAHFTSEQAAARLHYREEEFGGIEWTEGTYGGYVVAPRPGDLVAARRLAERRPFGETVERLLTDYFRAEDGAICEQGLPPDQTIRAGRRN